MFFAAQVSKWVEVPYRLLLLACEVSQMDVGARSEIDDPPCLDPGMRLPYHRNMLPMLWAMASNMPVVKDVIGR